MYGAAAKCESSSKRFHLALLSDLCVDPTFICPASLPTAKSTNQLSSVSPDRAETTVPHSALLAVVKAVSAECRVPA